jgi:ribosome-dependent ATPase
MAERAERPGYGMSFDVDNLPYAAYDQDRTLEIREFLEGFSGSRHFEEHREIGSAAELDQRLGSGELALAIEIPPNFGKDLIANRRPEASIWLDGADTFRAATAQGYLDGVEQAYFADQIARGPPLALQAPPVVIDTRFRDNQAFESVNAIVPGVIMLLLVLIPAMMTAVGVVREKETGSIANFQSTPITKLEFLLGKQAPCVAIALVGFVAMLLLAVFLFRVPVRGSIATLFLGVGAYLCATTGFGLLISSFTKTQVAAVFGTAILTILPAQDFSGLLIPVSSLPGSGRAIALGFPGGWFQQISVGTITKGLGIAALWPDILALVGFAVVFIAAAALALREQEA